MQLADQQDNKTLKPQRGHRKQARSHIGSRSSVGVGLARDGAIEANKSARPNTTAIHWCAKM